MNIYFLLLGFLFGGGSLLFGQQPEDQNTLPPEIRKLRELKETEPLKFEKFLKQVFLEESNAMLKIFWTRERLERIRETYPLPYHQRLNRYFPSKEEESLSMPLQQIRQLKIENPDQYWYLLESQQPQVFYRKRALKQVHRRLRENLGKYREEVKQCFPEQADSWLKKHEKWAELEQLRKKDFESYQKKLFEYFPEEAAPILKKEKNFQELKTLRKTDFRRYLIQLRKLEPRKTFQVVQNEMKRAELLDLKQHQPELFAQKYREYFPQECQQKEDKRVLLKQLMQLKNTDFPLFLKQFKKHFPERYEEILKEIHPHGEFRHSPHLPAEEKR